MKVVSLLYTPPTPKGEYCSAKIICCKSIALWFSPLGVGVDARIGSK